MRIFAVSDIHSDYAANLECLRRWSAGRKDDALLVAGDVSDNLAILRETLGCAVERFGKVFFTPGNHDLWCTRDEAKRGWTSLDKLRAVRDVCAELGVSTGPEIFEGVLVVPLMSWYHASFDTEPDVEGVPPSRRMSVEEAMADFYRCKWPEGLTAAGGSTSLAEYFDGQNTDVPAGRDGPVVSFSHFLPRLELLPEKRFLYFPPLAQAVGSHFLGRRVERLAPDVHVFGHTHFAWCAKLGGCTYIQNAMAYPRERERRLASLTLAPESTTSGADDVPCSGSPAPPTSSPSTFPQPLLVYDSERDPPVLQYTAYWSEFYRRHPRATEPTRWVYA